MYDPMTPQMGQMNALNAPPQPGSMLGLQSGRERFSAIMNALHGVGGLMGRHRNHLQRGPIYQPPTAPAPVPGTQTNPGTQGPPVGGLPQIPNTQFPLNPLPPQNMVGSSYAVQGMTPASNPYGLPTY